jgi:heat shock protein HslJ
MKGTRTLLSLAIMCAFPCMIYSEAFSAAVGLEGPQWQLAEVAGAPVSPPVGERRPFIRFDETRKHATGFSGCNNFFAGYELDGSLLKFGPIGSTRMVCPDPESALEAEFLNALEMTRGWKISDGALLLIGDTDVLARFTAAKEDEGAVDLESMSFFSTWFSSGRVTLSHGEYREAAAPGSASEIIVKLSKKGAFGTVNGRETGAVVLATESGGSGTFYDLALLTKEEGGWVNTDTVLLGDRVKVHSVEIKDNFVVVDMTMHGPGAAMCCPALEVKKRFAVQGNRLMPATEVEPEEEGRLVGTVWQWVRTLYNDDRKSAPSKPQNYTIQFLEAGKVNVRADCNLKGGTYSREGKRLSINITHSTMAACEEGSMEELFIRDLTGAAILFFQAGDLYIDLRFDTGTMKFSKQKQK